MYYEVLCPFTHMPLFYGTYESCLMWTEEMGYNLGSDVIIEEA
jgi:hypothetical protein